MIQINHTLIHTTQAAIAVGTLGDAESYAVSKEKSHLMLMIQTL